MQYSEFCYWLRGYIELGNPQGLSKEQLEEVKRHLDICFNSAQDIRYLPGWNLPMGSC